MSIQLGYSEVSAAPLDNIAADASSNPWKASVVAELAEVTRNKAVNAEYRHLIVNCGDEAAAASPGQFFQLLCPQPVGEAPFLRRPMSLYGADRDKRQVEFLYKVTGAGTRGLDTLRPGDRLDILGPLGVGFALNPAWRHIVAVGRGAGLATLAPLANAAKTNGTHVTAIFSARRRELLVSVELFHSHGADVIAVTDSEQTSGPANVERILRRLIADDQCENSACQARLPWSSKWPAALAFATAACATSTSIVRSSAGASAGMALSSI
jgi:dihydroorotate dehydrogenase electron transfer subunit